MDWSTITADADFMRAGNEDLLSPSEYPPSALRALYQTPAKRKVKSDLIGALRLKESDSSDMDLLDDVVDGYQYEIQEALAYYQLYLYYYGIQSGEGSQTHERMKLCLRNYEQKKNGFINYRIDEYSQSRSLNYVRS